MENSALIIVDLQNDFMPGGPLGVPDANAIIPLANLLQPHFDLVIATQDWHPAEHGSFAANHPGCKPGEVIELHGLSQVLWPVHCVQNTSGAALVSTLHQQRIAHIAYKGIDPDIDSYSAFFDNARRRKTDLDDYLKSHQIGNLYFVGVATEYCVNYSVLDAIYLDYHPHVIIDACRGINLQPNDVEKAIAEMKAAGATIINSEDILIKKRD